eukprot:m.95359 g.95359  ORF g.95359 m.95359 type:complete len:81 (-) comp14764_c1_seq4:84-326(-)
MNPVIVMHMTSLTFDSGLPFSRLLRFESAKPPVVSQQDDLQQALGLRLECRDVIEVSSESVIGSLLKQLEKKTNTSIGSV